MPSADELAPAVAAGIITAEQARRVAALGMPAVQLATEESPAADADDEVVHFARGFQDVFLTIGLVLLMAGAAIAAPLALGVAAGAFAVAGLAFALAWYFTRRRMLVLPSIALAIGFSLFIGMGTGLVLGGQGWADLMPRYGGVMSPLSLLAGGVAAGLAAALFFALFRLPFALALIAVSMIYVVFGGLSLALGAQAFAPMTTPALLGLGLVTFAVAMAFDLRDPRRRTLNADNAFWLHLVAAPMIVHSLIALLVPAGATGFPLAVIGIVVVFGLLALVIDRRALLVAGLGYLAFAISRLLADADIEGAGLTAATLVFVGAAVVILGAGWRPIRSFLLQFVGSGLRRHLPPEARG